MNIYIENIKKSIEPLRQQIIHHPVYALIKDIEDLQTFMQYHVYAVWDFMSLLKALQQSLTCTQTPWFPKGSAETRYLINEIVVGEESDIDLHGNRKSHFEMYLDAMQQCGADTSNINTFIHQLKKIRNVSQSLVFSDTPQEAQEFVNFTFEIIESQKDYLQAAIFTFGREDLIPSMFISIIEDMYHGSPETISYFKYYLERHIEVDGEHHSHLAIQMLENLCGNNQQYWQEAEKAILVSLQKRIHLWNGVAKKLQEKTTFLTGASYAD